MLVLHLRYLVQRDQIEELMELYKTRQDQAAIRAANPTKNIVDVETGDDGKADFFTQQQKKAAKKKGKKSKSVDSSQDAAQDE